MKNKPIKLALILVTLIFSAVACSLLSSGGDVSHQEETLFDGVTYIKEEYNSPRKMVVHIVKINVAKATIKPFITPADDPTSDTPYQARTVSQFAEEFGVQLAINGGGFDPWYDYKLVYYPHAGDSVTPLGRVISDNILFDPEDAATFPLLLFGGKRPVDISYIDTNAQYAVSGIRMLVEDGEPVADLNDSDLAPRTAAGIDNTGHNLVIVVVDGRQIGYSRGATLAEMAQFLIDNGAVDGLELDGGGSSTLVVDTGDGPKVLNSPIHRGIPGLERPVATQIGFYIN
ncbi:phosphodiester glycosidase family protein [bacterium]|nr:phosphodiester glycosidase family protein [bacterium]MCB2179372.1 phosphodiester glycosidase family protein [bacterium]